MYMYNYIYEQTHQISIDSRDIYVQVFLSGIGDSQAFTHKVVSKFQRLTNLIQYIISMTTCHYVSNLSILWHIQIDGAPFIILTLPKQNWGI